MRATNEAEHPGDNLVCPHCGEAAPFHNAIAKINEDVAIQICGGCVLPSIVEYFSTTRRKPTRVEMVLLFETAISEALFRMKRAVQSARKMKMHAIEDNCPRCKAAICFSRERSTIGKLWTIICADCLEPNIVDSDTRKLRCPTNEEEIILQLDNNSELREAIEIQKRWTMKTKEAMSRKAEA